LTHLGDGVDIFIIVFIKVGSFRSRDEKEEDGRDEEYLGDSFLDEHVFPSFFLLLLLSLEFFSRAEDIVL